MSQQYIKPKQIAPSGTDGQVLTTVSGVAAWANDSGLTNPMTTQDDIIVGGSSGTPTRLAKGTDGQILTVSPSTHHLVWATPSGGTGTGTRIYIASQNGCALDTSLTSGGGTDDTSAVQSMLNNASGGTPILVIMDGPALVSGIDVYSNTTIWCLDGAGFYLKNGSSRAIVRNVNRTRSTITDQHITLIGGVYNGNGGNNGGGGTGSNQESDNTFIVGLQFYGVNYLTIRDVKVLHACSFHAHIANANYININNLHLDYGATALNNNDGLHLNGPISFLYVSNIKIHSNDDAIGINAGDANVVDVTIANILGPYVGQGLIQDVIIDGVELDSCRYGIRVLSHDSNSKANRISVKNVTGTVTLNYSIAATNYGAGTGAIGYLEFENIDVLHSIGNGDDPAYAHFSSNIESLVIRGFHVHKPIINDTVIFVDSGVIDSLLIEDFSIYDTTNGFDYTPCYVTTHVKNFRARNWNWYRSGVSQATSFLRLGTGGSPQVDILSINGWVCNLVTCPLYHLSGTIGYLQAVNIHHTDTGNGPTFYSASGTITEVNISNWYASGTSVVFSGTASATTGDAFGGGGTVSSVALTEPAEFVVSGSPITTSGTLAVTKATQTANKVWAGPTSGGAAQPTFRSLVLADIPAGVGHTIQDEGSSLPGEAYLNFVGSGVVAADDSGNSASKVTVNRWEILTNGDGTTPELIFDSFGDCIYVEVPT